MPDAVGTTPFAYKTFILFCLVALVTLVGTPLIGYLYGYTLFDWVLFGILYVFTGLGITVGYHRLISHRSFECHPWVKALLLIIGVMLATAGGVITYRALYVEPKSVVVITDTDIRQLPNYTRVVGGALLFVGGTALALFAATRRAK